LTKIVLPHQKIIDGVKNNGPKIPHFEIVAGVKINKVNSNLK